MATNEKKGAGMAWLFGLIAIVLGAVASFAGTKLGLSGKVMYALFVVIFGGCAFLATFMTKAGAGMGVLVALVASLGTAIVSYVMVSMIVSSAVGTLGEASGQLAGAVGAKGADAALLEQGTKAAGNVVGAIGGIFVAVINFIISFVAGIIGAIVGAKAKGGATAGGAKAAVG